MANLDKFHVTVAVQRTDQSTTLYNKVQLDKLHSTVSIRALFSTAYLSGMGVEVLAAADTTTKVARVSGTGLEVLATKDSTGESRVSGAGVEVLASWFAGTTTARMSGVGIEVLCSKSNFYRRSHAVII